MTRATSIVLALLVMTGTAVPVAAGGPKPVAAGPDGEPPTTAAAGEIIPGEVIVQFHEGQGPDTARGQGLAVVAELGKPGKAFAALVSTGGRPVEEAVADLKANPLVAHAEPNYRVQVVNEGSVAAVGVNDPKSGDQYSLDRMRVRDAWSLAAGAANVVAVLDTGVQYDHPDLAGRLLQGYNFVAEPNTTDASDDNGHGTWVSGIIAANPNDGYGMAGISWLDKILPVKIMNGEGNGSTADLLAAITWSADQGADVINMSVGGFPYSQIMQDAVNYAFSKGAVLVGAAGNNRREENFYPASFDNVISVSATQVEDEFSNWSSWGPKVDVSAPGSSVLTTNCYVCTYAGHNTWGSHTFISGTSFATPNVAGVIALMRARFPSYSPQQIVNQLFATVDDLGYPGWDNRYGRGRVNAYRALGASVGSAGPTTGDNVEPNNTLAAARMVGLGTLNPSLHPAGDVDVFAIDLPSPGRLDVRVGGVVDTRAYPWNKSGLPVDAIVELYNNAGGLIARVDNEWESGTETASVTVAGPSRILVRISNWYANGNKNAYTMTTTFVDAVPPTLVAIQPSAGAVDVRADAATVTADFSEAVTGVNASSFTLRDPSGNLVPANVSYASGRATLSPTAALAGETLYTASLSAQIKDAVGNAFGGGTWSFTTGVARMVARVAGSDRYASAAAVSRSAFNPGVPVAFIATGASFPDALAGGSAAKVQGGPLLLTAGSSLPAATAAELGRLRPARIVVLGGPGAVSDNVVAQLGAYTTGPVARVSGSDRFATAAAISRTVFASAGVVYVATGGNYPDALAAGATAAINNAPILLVSQNGLPAATAGELARLRPSQIIVMGGVGAVSDAVMNSLRAYSSTVNRVAGPDRYSTAVALSAASFATNSVVNVYVATGQSFPDGLAAGPVAGLNGAPLLLVGANTLPPSVASELRRLDPNNVIIVGGTGVVSDAVLNAIRALWP